MINARRTWAFPSSVVYATAVREGTSAMRGRLEGARIARWVLLLTISFWVLVGIGRAHAQGEPADPKAVLSLAGSASPVLFLHTSDDAERATAHVLVINSGNAAAEGVGFHLFVDTGSERTAYSPDTVSSDDGSQFDRTLGAATTTALELDFSLPEGSIPRAAVLEVSADQPDLTTPVAVALTLQRVIEREWFWFPIGFGFLASLVVMAIAARKIPNPEGETNRPASWWKMPVYTESAYSTKDSWATNITAVGALLGTILGATGFVAEAVPWVSTGRFTGLSLLFGGAVLLAPLLYVAFGTRMDIGGWKTFGTRLGLLVAGLVTLTAVIGGLASLALLVVFSDAPPVEVILYFSLLLGAAVGVSIYSVRNLRWTSSQKRPDPTAAMEQFSGASGGVTARASGAL